MEIALDSIGLPPQPRARKCPPARLRVLFLSSRRRPGKWLAASLECDGATRIDLLEALPAEGLNKLRDESFDAVLLVHDPPEIDALTVIEALCGGGAESPVIVLGEAEQTELEPHCYEAGADGFCTIETTSVRALIWNITRAIERAAMRAENRRLLDAQRQQLEIDHQEVSKLLRHQRAMIGQIDSSRDGSRTDLPAAIARRYRDLLRTYVIMGSGNLPEELSTLAGSLVELNAGGRQATQMHLDVLEEVASGLGNRSGRHVINRADLLALELLANLVELYRQRPPQDFSS